MNTHPDAPGGPLGWSCGGVRFAGNRGLVLGCLSLRLRRCYLAGRGFDSGRDSSNPSNQCQNAGD